MQTFTSLISIACLALASHAAPALAEMSHDTGFDTGDAISLDPAHPNSFRNFAPELPQLRARVAPINTDYGLHLSEIEPGLFFVTDQVYQSAFLVTDAGVVVFDAPPSFGDNLRAAIAQAAPGAKITHMIMSHGHRDHNGGGTSFADIEALNVIAASDVADTLRRHPLPGVLTPTETFDEALDLVIGGVPIALQTTHFHAEDTDVMIYLPDQKFLMAIDTITPGEVPFMNFGATSNVQAYLDSFDTLLAYDFTHFLSGHVSVLGTRDDVIASRDYAHDVRDTALRLMPTFDARMFEALEAVEFQNANLAFRYGIEALRRDCAAEIIDRWKAHLSVVDLWADSHCETVVLYNIMH